MTDEPFSELLACAISMHELYLTYQEAGFTKDEALYLVSAAVRPERSKDD